MARCHEWWILRSIYEGIWKYQCSCCGAIKKGPRGQEVLI